MRSRTHKPTTDKPSAPPAPENPSAVWKGRNYVIPMPTRKGFQWRASAIRGLQRIGKTKVTGQPVTVVVPALHNLMPAETVALGWLNEIDALVVVRNRILATAKITGWDVFTFHTRFNLDPFYSSMITAVRETWLREGILQMTWMRETVRRYGRAYDYNRIEPRLIENLVFQSSMMDWMSNRTKAPLRFHVVGTALLSALVWSGATTFNQAVRAAMKIGSAWDEAMGRRAEEELKQNATDRTDDNLGWQRFHRVQQILEGHSVVNLGLHLTDIADVDAPVKPFWFSATANDEPVLIQTSREVRTALESMDLASWTPASPKGIDGESTGAGIRGWLISASHPLSAACHWSVYNCLLATPTAASLFLDHIAALGRAPAAAEQDESVQNRLRLSRMKVTGP